MSYYPVYLDLRQRPCTIIGTGHEAERKASDLLAAGAIVTVVTPRPTPALESLAANGAIVLRQRAYQDGDLAGVFLAIAVTTEDLDLSGRIAEEARRERVLLNVVDVTPLCTWIAPAIVRRGDLTLAISTNGLSPAMARFAKERVNQALPEEYAALLEVLTEVRHELRRRNVRPRPDAWQAALDEETLNLLWAGDLDGVQARLLKTLGSLVEAH